LFENLSLIGNEFEFGDIGHPFFCDEVQVGLDALEELDFTDLH
jgi:hypothetical protein